MLLSCGVARFPRRVILTFHGVKTTLGFETTLLRSRNYPLSKGTEMTPRGKNYSSEFTVYTMSMYLLYNLLKNIKLKCIELVINENQDSH
jgi:hypothetical protein